MAFSPEEQARIRDYLGYPNLMAVQSIQLGFPAASQALFLVDSALTRARPEAETAVVRKHLAECDRIDGELADARRLLKARSVGSVELNPDRQLPDLRREQRYWAARLADALGAPLNTYAERWAGLGSVNMAVRHDV